jgi:serine/threonine protein kinase
MIRESRGLDRDITTHRRRINNYLITAKVGSGSSSHVYSAIDEATNREVAVKRIKIRDMIRAGNGVAQLERELHLIRRFNHPNILKLIEVLYTELKGEVYLILEYAEKGSVAGFLERGQRLSRDAVFGIMHQVIDALRYLHSLGFVHQDVKPGNILLDSSGRAFLADLGLDIRLQVLQWLLDRLHIRLQRRLMITVKMRVQICRWMDHRKRMFGRSG